MNHYNTLHYRSLHYGSLLYGPRRNNIGCYRKMVEPMCKSKCDFMVKEYCND